jgi:hypothetical protein
MERQNDAYSRMDLEMESAAPDAMRYLEKVAKVVPSEIVAGYLTLVGFVPLIRQATIRPWVYAAAFAICVILTPLYMNAQADKAKPKRRHLILSTVAFIVWAYAVSGNAVAAPLYDPAVASILLVVFSLISGAIPLIQ